MMALIECRFSVILLAGTLPWNVLRVQCLKPLEVMKQKHIKKSVLIPEEDTSIFFLSQFPRFPSSPDGPKPKWSSNLCLFSVTHNDTVPLIGPENESARKISGHSACRHEYNGLHYTMYDARFDDFLSFFLLFPNQLTKPQPMLNTGIDGPSMSSYKTRMSMEQYSATKPGISQDTLKPIFCH